MPLSLVINGITYNYPQSGDELWGDDATNWAQAVTQGMLQKAGGLFQLTSEVDFGSSYGVKALTYKSRSANIASTGQIRLAHNDVISFRNLANSGNLNLDPNPASDILSFNSIDLVDISSSQTLTNKTINLSTITGFTANRAIASNGAGDLIASAVTSTELGFVAGLTSSAVGTTQSQTLSGKTFAQHILPSVNNNFDLGETGTRWKDLFLSGSASVTGNIAVGSLTLSTISFSALTTVTIVNNTTADVFTTPVASTNIVVHYGLVRGTAKETGEIILTCDGSSVRIAPYSVTLTSPGVDFTADINGGNIRLRYTSDNSGLAGTMKYYRESWSD